MRFEQYPASAGRSTCPCGWTPDPGYIVGAGCNCCPSSNAAVAETLRRDRHRRTHKPVLFFALGRWRVLAYDYQRGWRKAIEWTEARS